MITWVARDGSVRVLVHEDGRLAQIGDNIVHKHSGWARRLQGSSDDHVHVQCDSSGKRYAGWPEYYGMRWRAL